VFVKINGERHYRWRVVDHEGKALESYVTKKRDKAAALVLLESALERDGRAEKIITDGPRSYSAVMRALGNAKRWEMGWGLGTRPRTATFHTDYESGRICYSANEDTSEDHLGPRLNQQSLQ